MSFQAMTWAINHKLPALQKLVLLMLANRSNHETGKCIPKIKTLAEECGTSERSVQRAIHELEALGLLKIIYRTHEGVQLSNQYNLCFWVRGELEFKASPQVTDSHPQVTHGHPGVPERRTEPGIEPGIEPIPPSPKGEPAQPEPPSKATPLTTLKAWIAAKKLSQSQLFPPEHAVFAYAQNISLDPDLIALAWHVFKGQHMGSGKRYREWDRTFLNAIKGNWLRLWAKDRNSDAWVLTTAGEQAQREREAMRNDQADKAA